MLITLLSDFGTQDTFVGVMKGVIQSIAPDATMVDLTHHVPSQNVLAGAFALKTAYSYFPPGTIHLAVVDPGVGGGRQPLAAQIGDYLYVCPDNGLLSYILARETAHRAVTLDNPRYRLPQVSRTFHGRDIFAPAAACLAAGVTLEALGTPVERLLTLPLPRPDIMADQILAHVLYIDVFGNVFLDVTEDMTKGWGELEADIRGVTVGGPADSYVQVPEGSPVAIFGSSGHLEIAVRNGNAARRFGLRVGDTLRLRRKNSGPERTLVV